MQKIDIAKEELEACVDAGMRYEAIAKKFKCSFATIDKRFRETKARRPKPRTKTWITKEMLAAQLAQGKHAKELALFFHCDTCTIRRLCHRYSLPLPGPFHARVRKKTFDTRFFKTIDTEEKAYILGFICADGGRDRNWGIKISIHPKDAELLHKFARALKCNYEPQYVEHGTRVKLSLYDVDMVKDLEQYGVVERKTFSLPFAQNVPEEFIPAYFRGMFDGDGSFSAIKGQTSFVCGSDTFVSGLLAWVKHRYGFDLWTRRDGKKTYVVIRKCEAALIHDMYANATIYLERKMARYKKFWVKQ